MHSSAPGTLPVRRALAREKGNYRPGRMKRALLLLFVLAALSTLGVFTAHLMLLDTDDTPRWNEPSGYNFPLYPNAQQVETTDASPVVYASSFKTGDPAPAVLSFYRDTLLPRGWVLDETPPEDPSGMLVLSWRHTIPHYYKLSVWTWPEPESGGSRTNVATHMQLLAWQVAQDLPTPPPVCTNLCRWLSITDVGWRGGTALAAVLLVALLAGNRPSKRRIR